MRASSNFTKAIHICLFLNVKEGELQSSAQLAESVDTNPVVIRRLVGRLRNAGLVGSVAGPQGGFHLSQSPEDLNLWEIYLAVREDELFVRPKVNPDCDISCNLELLVHDTFQAAEMSMKTELEGVSIQQLSEKLDGIRTQMANL
ncbi:MAG: Rrf2 family transcriptional regulator [Bacteroidota bacterium]